MQWFWTQFLIFQALWLAAIMGGNGWLLIVVIALLVLHFIASPSRQQDTQVLPIALIGMAVDTVLTLAGLFHFDQFPLWLGLLWVAFVLTLGHSLAWLRKLPRLTLAPIGAVAGAMSYLAGWRLGAVELPLGGITTGIALATVWALLLPTLVLLDQQIRRTT